MSGYLLLFTSCNEDDIQPTAPNLFVAPSVSRTVIQITLVDEMTIEDGVFNANLELDFYRNEAYEAGLSNEANPEYYTFMVINPNNEPNASAPLWVYLHGGAQGYFDEQGVYQSNPNQDEHTWNHEESFDDFWQIITNRTIENGQLEDNTLKSAYSVLMTLEYAGLNTWWIDCCISRSTTVGIPKRRVPPFGFGIETARTACGRYVPLDSSPLMPSQYADK